METLRLESFHLSFIIGFPLLLLEKYRFRSVMKIIIFRNEFQLKLEYCEIEKLFILPVFELNDVNFLNVFV